MRRHGLSGPPYGARPVYEKSAFVGGLGIAKARQENGWANKMALILETGA